MHQTRIVVVSCVVALAAVALAKPAAGIVFPKGTKLLAGYGDNDSIDFKPDEKVAYLLVWSLHKLEQRCHDDLDRYCKLDELVRGVPGKDKRVIGLRVDPARDPNYRYSVEIGDDYKITAEPRHAGIGGFLDDEGTMGGIYFNPDGPATRKSREIKSNGWGVGPGGEGSDFER